jgi:hypothetical protein
VLLVLPRGSAANLGCPSFENQRASRARAFQDGSPHLWMGGLEEPEADPIRRDGRLDR